MHFSAFHLCNSASKSLLTTTAHAQRRVVGLRDCRSVRLSVCRNVFSRTVAMVGTKHGYVGRYKERYTQQESGAALSKDSVFTVEAKCTVWISCES